MNDEPRMLIRLTSFGYKWTRNKYEINSVCGRSIECTFSNCFWPILNLMLSINNAVRNHSLMIINGLNGPPFSLQGPLCLPFAFKKEKSRAKFHLRTVDMIFLFSGVYCGVLFTWFLKGPLVSLLSGVWPGTDIKANQILFSIDGNTCTCCISVRKHKAN